MYLGCFGSSASSFLYLAVPTAAGEQLRYLVLLAIPSGLIRNPPSFFACGVWVLAFGVSAIASPTADDFFRSGWFPW